MRRNNGLYLPDGSFQRFAEAGKTISLTTELATRSRSIDFFALGNMYLPNPDPILRREGKDIQVYRDLLTDDRVGAGQTNRFSRTKSLDWQIDRGKSKTRQARAVQDVFARLKLHRIIDTFLQCRGYGYAPTEVIWDVIDGLTVPVDLIGKPQRWFVVAGDNNEWRMLTKQNLLNGEELPPRKFLFPTHDADYDNPYGLGILARCFWPVIFKRGGLRFYVQFSEKLGQLFPVGKLPRNADRKEYDELLDDLESLIADGVAVIPDDGSVEFLESATKGATSDLFSKLVDTCNTAITTAWLGHGGAGESTSGKLGDEQGAIRVRDDIGLDDKTLVEEQVNTLIDWICEVNWGSAQGAPRFSLWEEEEIDQSQAKRDKDLTDSLERSGLRLTRAYYQREYNLEEGDIEDAPADQAPVKASAAQVTPVQPVQFADPDPAAQDSADIAATRLSEVTEPVITKWLQALKREVDQAGNLIDLRADLLKVKGLDLADLAAPIRDGLLLSRLAGRADVMDEIAASEAGQSFSHIDYWSQFAEPYIISALNLPFNEAISFFRNKVSIPTERWNDLFIDQHSQGFMIAGAIKGDLIADIRDAVDQAISSGLTLEQFRQQWDAIVERHGWTYNGGRNWRTRIVYETNTRQAYNAGRWQQVTDPDVLKTRPYLAYRHGDSIRPRPLHLAWNGTVLPADDPWWATHSPQNGWGCKCKVFSVGERDIKRMGDQAKRSAPQDGSYQWTDKQGRTFTIPNGIDPGFQYNPGAAAQKSKDILNDRINQLPPDIAKGIRAEITQGEKQR